MSSTRVSASSSLSRSSARLPHTGSHRHSRLRQQTARSSAPSRQRKCRAGSLLRNSAAYRGTRRRTSMCCQPAGRRCHLGMFEPPWCLTRCLACACTHRNTRRTRRSQLRCWTTRCCCWLLRSSSRQAGACIRAEGCTVGLLIGGSKKCTRPRTSLRVQAQSFACTALVLDCLQLQP